MLNYEPRHKNVWLSGGIAPLILYFSTRWRWTVTFMPLLIYIRWKSLRYTLDMRLRGNQGRSGLCERKTFCRAWESNTDFEVRILKSEVMLFNWIINYEMKWLANKNQTRSGSSDWACHEQISKEIVYLDLEKCRVTRASFWRDLLEQVTRTS